MGALGDRLNLVRPDHDLRSNLATKPVGGTFLGCEDKRIRADPMTLCAGNDRRIESPHLDDVTPDKAPHVVDVAALDHPKFV